MLRIVLVYIKTGAEVFLQLLTSIGSLCAYKMSVSLALFAICCLTAAQAKPSHFEGSHHQLYGVPDEYSYGKLIYPKYDIIDLGSEQKDELPPKTIKVSKTITIKVPKPYPIKVPVKVPFPVHIPKPYPVVQTKLVEVPHPVPVHVDKPIHVPYEVPKPYPVPSEEIKAPQVGSPGGGHDFSGSIGGHQEAGGSDGQHGFGGSFGGSFGGHQEAGGSEGQHGFSPSFGGSFGGHEEQNSGSEGHQLGATYGVPGHEPGAPLGGSNYNSFESQGESGYGGSDGGHGEDGQSNQYEVSDQQENAEEHH